MSQPARIAVLDVGKTHVKLSAVTDDGVIAEQVTTENRSWQAPLWLAHDTAALADWLMASLAGLCRRHPLDTIVPVGHGSCSALVGGDVEVQDEPVVPMIDYENPIDPDIAARYVPLAGSFLSRGSALMMGTSHMARQLFLIEELMPQAVAGAAHCLALPQYWAWRLTGRAVREPTSMGAQSHLYDVAGGCDSAIVQARHWQHLLPPWARAWHDLGPVRPHLVRRHGLPGHLRVLAGFHDSSANLYRYLAAGLHPVTVVSTGTWVVGLAGGGSLDRLDERRGMTINADVEARPVPGILSMAGREFAMIAGDDPSPATIDQIGRLVEAGVFALPGRTDDDGLFPGSRGRGCLVGTIPDEPGMRRAAALLFGAAMTAECLDALGPAGPVVLDGAFVRDPLYPALVAAMTGLPVRTNPAADGVAAGAALLATHETRRQPAGLDLAEVPVLPRTARFQQYRQDWRRLASDNAAGRPVSLQTGQ